MTLSRSSSLYYTDVSRTSTVTDPQEERRLILRWQKHDDIKARDTIVKGHLRFVVTMARKRSHDPEKIQDFIAAGNLGLLKAIDKFDLSRKPPTRFLTYAGWWVQKEIADEDYATSSLVHVPTHRQKARRKQVREFQKAIQRNDANPTEPRAREGIIVDIEALRGTSDEEAGSASIYDASRTGLLLRRAVGHLPIREQTVLNLYFGTKDEPRNLAQIAAILDMCPERVRQIKVSGMKKLRVELETIAVRSALDAY